jgi:hypothetical protein
MNKIESFCKRFQITEDQFYGREKIQGDLNLCSVKSFPEGFNPHITGTLNLNGLEKLLKSFSPIVDGNLLMFMLEEITEEFCPIVGGYLNMPNIKKITKDFKPIVGGSLYISKVVKIPFGFRPIVGKDLFLNSVKKIPARFKPIVGGTIKMPLVKIIPELFNPVVGGALYYDGKYLKDENPDVIVYWQDDKYILADNVLMEVVSKRKNVYHVKHIGKNDVFYLVTDGEKFAHGITLKDARKALLFKISDRDVSKYKGVDLSTSMSPAEIIECYRVITGACEFGVREFIISKLNGKLKKSYTIAEVIKITENSYGSETFKNFFKKGKCQ